MRGVPPQAACMPIPAGGRGELERACGVVQVAALVRGAERVEERGPPPAVVVEPRAHLAAVARVWRVAAVRPESAVPVALAAVREGVDGMPVCAARLGDRHAVDRLEQRYGGPDRRERVAAAVAESLVVPVPARVPPAAVHLRDAGLRQA